MTSTVEIAGKRIRGIYSEVQSNLANKDKEGYAFLTNTTKTEGELSHIEFARQVGFKNPLFKKKEAIIHGIVRDDSDAWWVKEGQEE